MTSATAIDFAEEKLRWMVNKEMRGPGDAGGALDRLIQRHRWSGSAVKALLYRKPADIYLSVFISINVAYEAEVARWERAFEHERAIARAKTAVGTALLRLADTLDGPAGPHVGGDEARS